VISRYFIEAVANTGVYRGGGASTELAKVFSERRQQSDLCQSQAAEECRRYTELVLQHDRAAAERQRATMEQQCRHCNNGSQRLAGAPC